MNTTNRTIVSRRSRPAKAPLSQEVIVKTALELLRKEGSSGLSMRKIAKVLDTGPSSLYVYVTNLQELNAYVLDLGLEEVLLPDVHAEDWKKELFDFLKSYLDVLYQFPGLAALVQTTISVGPNSLAITECILQLLNRAGIHSTAAAWGSDLFLFYAASVAFEQSSRDQNGTTLTSIAAFYQSLDAERYPVTASLKEEMLSGGEDRFRWGLEVILQGILQRAGS
ncbi:TetR/AcrR family transcriptional regulator [Paenibacillus sp. HWE-109]|nr:TetR/AcrR family transcriptional regulator [Paenibacillus sp. HWE-109]UKS25871.1 TetR/AcrR family transcriptional regulator [Paenibacillus sp. HWE-109]